MFLKIVSNNYKLCIVNMKHDLNVTHNIQKIHFLNSKQIIEIKKKLHIHSFFTYSHSEIALKACRNIERFKFICRPLWIPFCITYWFAKKRLKIWKKTICRIAKVWNLLISSVNAYLSPFLLLLTVVARFWLWPLKPSKDLEKENYIFFNFIIVRTLQYLY